MATYTVRAGDSLSAIGAKFGVPYQQITGYSSGNPNLIKPGEVLNIPGGGGSSIRTLHVTGPAPVVQQPQQQVKSQPQQQVMQQPQQQMSGGGANTAAGLVAQGYYGYAGWSDADAQANFAATGGAGKGGPTGGGANTAQPSIPDFQGIYDSAIQQGTKDYLAQSDAVTQKLLDRERSKNEQAAKIGDNPYLSEATMSGRLAKIDQKYNADTANLLNEQRAIEGKISGAKADAQVKLGIAQNQYNLENQQYQQTVQKYSSLLSAGALTNASGQDIAQAALAIGVPTSMIQSIIDKQKKDAEVKPTLQTIDDGTNQYVVAIDDKGNVINKSVIGQSKPTKTTGGLTAGQSAAQAKEQNLADVTTQVYDTFNMIKGGQGYVSKEDWAKMKSAVLASGAMTASQFDKEFDSFKNPEGADNGYIYN